MIVTAANEHDITQAANLIHEDNEVGKAYENIYCNQLQSQYYNNFSIQYSELKGSKSSLNISEFKEQNI